jgi:fatty acid desaturase
MTSQTIDKPVVQTLSMPSGTRTLRDLVMVWGVMAIVMAAALAVDRVYVYLLAVIIIGARQNALATLAHEGWHGLLFSSRRLNHNFAAWFYAYPLGILYRHDRERHLRHHREVGRDHDPDWINYTNRHRESPARLLWYLATLLLGRLLFSTLLSLATRGRPRIGVDQDNDTTREGKSGVFGELCGVLLCQITLFAVLTLASHRWWSYPVLWMLPLATFAGFFANLRALVEHVARRDDVLPEERLRDIEAGPLVRFFIAPSNFNYHALHHAHPSIPHYNLRRGREAYLAKFGRYPFTVFEGYGKALISHLRELRTGA